jgi:dihydroxyacetone kinase-like predicted kinase
VVRRLARRDGTGADPGVVVGTGAPGLVADLARSGAVVMVLTGSPVGSRDVLRVVVDTGAPHVVVLPGSVPTLVAARAAAGVADVPVDVLDVTDDVRVVVALTAGAGQGPDAVEVMRAALDAVRTTTVDVPDVAEVLRAARRLLADGGELVTVVAGRALTAATTTQRLQRELTDALDAVHPGVEVVVLAGDQEQPAAAVAVE